MTQGSQQSCSQTAQQRTSSFTNRLVLWQSIQHSLGLVSEMGTVKPPNKVHVGDGPHVRQIQTNQARLGLVALDLNYHYV